MMEVNRRRRDGLGGGQVPGAEGAGDDKARGKGGRGCGDDGDFFHNYMSRKIDLQRRQFGLVLPPPPPPPDLGGAGTTTTRTTTSVALSISSREPRKTTVQNGDRNLEGIFPSTRDGGKTEGGSGRMKALLLRLERRHGRSGKERRRTESGVRRAAVVESGKDIQTTTEGMGINRTLTVGKVASLGRQPEVSSEPPHKPPTLSLDPESPRPPLHRRTDLFFTGVVILVNGFTVPDASSLQRILHRHGGDLDKYETSRVTHIIASALSTAKALIYKRQRRPTPVVKPEWVTESVKAGRLIPHGDFLLEEVRDESVGNRTVKAFFGPGLPKNKSGKDSVAEMGSDSKNTYKKCHIMIETGGGDALPAENIVEEAIGGDRASALSSPLESRYDILDLTLEETDNRQNLKVSTKDNTPEIPLMRIENEPVGKKTSALSSSLESRHDILDLTLEVTNVSQKSKVSAKESMPKIPLVHSENEPVENSLRSLEMNNYAANDPKVAMGFVRSVGTDPNFLESYFAHSRLSFIGSFKQRVTICPGGNDISHGSHRDARGRTHRFVFHVDMDCFFASVILRKYPQYRDKPVAVGHSWRGGVEVPPQSNSRMGGDKKSYSELSTVNYVARQFGLKKGMFLHQAKSLCPDLVVLPYDYEGYKRVSSQVASILYRCAEGNGGTVEQVSCDESYVELFLPQDEGDKNDLKSATAYDSAGKLAEELRSEIYNETRCTASIGVGPNKFLAKLGTDRAKPDGLHVVRDWRELLGGLKLRDLPGKCHYRCVIPFWILCKPAPVGKT